MKPDYVQILNPKTQCYVKIDKTTGSIVSHHPRKHTPYKRIPIAVLDVSELDYIPDIALEDRPKMKVIKLSYRWPPEKEPYTVPDIPYSEPFTGFIGHIK